MKREFNYDVVVVGGGSAGVAAALGASRCGAKTLLLERHASFGGQSTNSAVTTYCGFFTRGVKPTQVVFGVGEEVLNGIRKYGGNADYTISKATGNVTVRFDPELLKCVLDELLTESKCDYLLHTQMIDVKRDGNDIKQITCIDDEGHYFVNAKVFIDASGDANLCNLAEVKTKWGDEQGKTQLASLPMCIENLPSNIEFMPEVLRNAIIKGKEAGYLPLGQEKGLILKVPEDSYGFCTIPSCQVTKLDAKTLTQAEILLRKECRNYLRAFKEFIPGFENIRISFSGPSIGLRESRRIIGEDSLATDDILSSTKKADSIARGGWSPDIHISHTDLRYVHMKDNEYFDIPLGCLKVAEMNNVWACGRIISCDSLAHASVRVMGTGFATGQAAGVAAAQQAITKKNVEVSKVREILTEQGALI